MIGVITTIRKPTPAVHRLAEALHRSGGSLIVIGDEKGPETYDLKGVEFLSLSDQHATDFELARLLPTNHYSRKNVGYLLALRRGTTFLYETDDDNAPLDCWEPRSMTVPVQMITPRPWFNVYRAFSDDFIWPRGFPLTRVRDPAAGEHDARAATELVSAPIQQGLVDGSPDVDAVWRMLVGQAAPFRTRCSVCLPKGTWCPFNSQSTWWWPQAYPLMYLPSHCSQRMTDIWRSFVAQRCLWELGSGVVFHGPEVVHQRNVHDSQRDFLEEVPGYQHNDRMAAALQDLSLDPRIEAVGDNLLTCYECLVDAEFFPQNELALVRAWLAEFPVT